MHEKRSAMWPKALDFGRDFSNRVVILPIPKKTNFNWIDLTVGILLLNKDISVLMPNTLLGPKQEMWFVFILYIIIGGS